MMSTFLKRPMRLGLTYPTLAELALALLVLVKLWKGKLIRVKTAFLMMSRWMLVGVLTCVAYPTGDVVLETHHEEALTEA